MLKSSPSTRQATLIIVVAACLWLPMALLMIYKFNDFSPRQIGVIALGNLAICVSILVTVYRRWISKL